MDKNIVLKTDRLVLRNFTTENFQDFVNLNQDKVVMKYFIGGAKTFRECLIKYQEITSTLEEYGYSYYAIYNKNNVFIGQCGILRNMDETLNLCYALRPKFCGNGFATEACDAVLEYVFKNFNVDKITAFAFEKNKKSTNLLKRLNFTQIKKTENNFGNIVYFELNKNDFRRN